MKSPLIYLLPCLLLILFYLPLNAHDATFGARSVGYGNASVSVADEFSIFTNPGGLGRVGYAAFFAGAENRFGMTEFTSSYAGLVYPTKFGSFGLGINRFGDEVFNRQSLGVAFGNKFGIVSLGIKGGLLQYHFENYGNASVFIVELGGIAQITPKLQFGSYIYNIGQAKFKPDNEYIPVILKSGLSYLPIKNLVLALDVEKEVDQKVSIKGGIEYQIIKKVFMRIGINSNPWRNFYGAGFNGRKIKVDYALGTHSVIGRIHQVSFSYTFIKAGE